MNAAFYPGFEYEFTNEQQTMPEKKKDLPRAKKISKNTLSVSPGKVSLYCRYPFGNANCARMNFVFIVSLSSCIARLIFFYCYQKKMGCRTSREIAPVEYPSSRTRELIRNMDVNFLNRVFTKSVL